LLASPADSNGISQCPTITGYEIKSSLAGAHNHSPWGFGGCEPNTFFGRANLRTKQTNGNEQLRE
jgi:hypothetical protein